MNDLAFYFGLGWDHIMSIEALDHILFVLVLAASYRPFQWKQVLILITAFTIGHSLTLALSVLSLVNISTAWVEFLIPLTIVITAFVNLFNKNIYGKPTLANYLLALFFGLIHGLGFANTLSFLMVSGQSLGWSLLGFNLGLEAGQVVIVALVLVVAQLVAVLTRLQQRHWIMGISIAVFGLAFKMAVERLPL